MENNNGQWLDIVAAAALVNRSPSTLRRAIQTAPASAIRRTPLQGQGGEKILFSRVWLLSRFPTAKNTITQNAPGGTTISSTNDIQRALEQTQLQVLELSERITQLAAINATLSQKLIAMQDTKPVPQPMPQKADGIGYTVAVAVVAALVACLLLWFLLGWIAG